MGADDLSVADSSARSEKSSGLISLYSSGGSKKYLASPTNSHQGSTTDYTRFISKKRAFPFIVNESKQHQR